MLKLKFKNTLLYVYMLYENKGKVHKNVHAFKSFENF